MKKTKRLVSLILSLVLSLSLVSPAFARSAEEMDQSKILLLSQSVDVEAAAEAAERIPGVSVRYTYSVFFNGISLEGTASGMAKAMRMDGVVTALDNVVWTAAEDDVEAETADTEALIENSLGLMNAAGTGYDGDGILIAVIDTGLREDHEAFKDYGLIENPALTEADVKAIIAGGVMPGRYLSAKVPFVYDYADVDDSVMPNEGDEGDHGSHVAGLAAGYARNEEGDVIFTGVAPAAQVMSLKVFPSAGGGAPTDVTIKALEDAYLLGADVVNLSLGSLATTRGDTNIYYTLYETAFAALRKSGAIVCAAMGNDGSTVDATTGYPTLDYTDYGTAGSPAFVDGATSIAASNPLFYGTEGSQIVVNGQGFFYNYSSDSTTGETLMAFDELAGETLPFVFVDGVGNPEDFEGLDLTGKIAFISRGEINFDAKAANAAAKGAVGCVIVNNVPGESIYCQGAFPIPTVSISYEDGEAIKAMATEGFNELTVALKVFQIVELNSLEMASFSSWGAAFDLGFEPAITAPGGLQYSVGSGSTDTYVYQGGTSMACPNSAGAFALLLQALYDRGYEKNQATSVLAEELMLSTAGIMGYSPRRQGAGLLDLAAALKAETVVHDPLVEMGEDEWGEYLFNLTVENLSDEDKTYDVETIVLTDNFYSNGYSAMVPWNITGYMDIKTPDTVTIPAGESKEIRVAMKVDRSLLSEFFYIFPNGFFTEGYIILTDAEGESVHASFMGYTGDWEAAPVIEPVDFRDIMNAYANATEGQNPLAGLPANLGYNIPYLVYGTDNTDMSLILGAENMFLSAAPVDARFAMSTPNHNAISMGGTAFYIQLWTLRSSAHVIMIVTDQETGEIYYVDDTAGLPHGYDQDGDGYPDASGYFTWDGTDLSGKQLPSGTAVDVRFYTWQEQEEQIQKAYNRNMATATSYEDYQWLINGGYDEWIEWEFPVTLDGEAPKAAAALNAETGAVEISVWDNQFLAYVAIQDADGNVFVQSPVADEEPGMGYVLPLDLSAYETLPKKLYITLMDYASNTIGYTIDLAALMAGEEVEAEISATAMLMDVEKDGWYSEAVDFVYETNLMDGSHIFYFEPEAYTTRATLVESLYRAAGCPAIDWTGTPMADLTGYETWYPAAEWAYNYGLLDGLVGDAFYGDAPISRAEVILVMYRFAALFGELKSYDASILEGKAGVENIPEVCLEAYAWAVGEGIITSIGADQGATRAAFAKMLMRFFTND